MAMSMMLEPSSDKPMRAKPLSIATFVKIRAHIDSLGKKAKAASKKVADWKKRLLKVHKALVEANKELDFLRVKIWWGTRHTSSKGPTLSKN